VTCSVTGPGGAGVSPGAATTTGGGIGAGGPGGAVGSAGGMATLPEEVARGPAGGGDTTITGSPVAAPNGGVPPDGRSLTQAAPIRRTTSVGTEASATSIPTISAYRRAGPDTP
jgi:hypothetical protein